MKSILDAACRLNSDFLSTWKGTKIETRLDFPNHYGWGSSSSLIYSVAQWAEVDPYELYEDTFGGSGYDIACASAKNSIIYHKENGENIIEEVNWQPEFIDQLYLVYQGKKADTSEALRSYKEIKKDSGVISDISDLTSAFYDASSLSELQKVISEHETILSEYLKLDKVKDTLLPELDGEVKSLGAWGGDFALVATEIPEEELRKLCIQKNLDELLKLKDVMYQEQ